MNLELHHLCNFFPRMIGAEFEALKADIKANGLRERIVIHEGQILDGSNRYAACLAVGVEPSTMDFTGPDAVAFILSANLHRRHLSPGQQAMIVAAAADWSKAQGVGRPDQSGNATGLQTVADRAAMSGASDKTQRGADAVAKADPELTRQVSHGEISLPKAVEKITGKRPGTRKSAADNEHVADAELEVARARIIKLDALIVERDARIVELEALSAEMLAEMSTITLRDGDARLFDQAA